MEVFCSLLERGQQGILPPIWVTRGQHGRDFPTPDTWGLHCENAPWILAEMLPALSRNLSLVLFEKFLWDCVSCNFIIKGFLFLFFKRKQKDLCMRLDFLFHNENREYISTIIYYINTSNHKDQRELKGYSRCWSYYIKGIVMREKYPKLILIGIWRPTFLMDIFLNTYR